MKEMGIVTCPACNGQGVDSHGSRTRCHVCFGKKVVSEERAQEWEKALPQTHRDFRKKYSFRQGDKVILTSSASFQNIGSRGDGKILVRVELPSGSIAYVPVENISYEHCQQRGEM